MLPTDALAHLGGAAHHGELTKLTTRRQLRTAVAKGQVLRLGRGCYGLASVPRGRAAAARLTAVGSHLTASLELGWEVAHPPPRPQLIVKRKRNLSEAQQAGSDIRYRDLDDHEVHGWHTSPHRTVIDCARDLPFTEALAVADSALRHGDVDHGELLKRARAVRSNGRREAMRVVEAATPLAANPFESVLRAIALDVPGLHVEPQVVIEDRGFRARPDLVDRDRRLVIEAESWEFHGHRAALARDCVRYTALAIRGWTVLRFSWEDVMLRPDYVLQALSWAVEGPVGQATFPESHLVGA